MKLPRICIPKAHSRAGATHPFATKAAARRFQFETLESRLTPTTTDIASFLTQDLLDSYQANAIQWGGFDAYAVRDEWILRFDAWSGSANQQLTLARSLIEASTPNLSIARYLGSDGMFLVKSSSSLTHTDLVGLLEPVAGFDYLEPNFLLVPTSIPNDTQYATQWALNNTGQSGGVFDADIDAPEAWSITTGSSGVVVAVIDSGVDYTHPDLAPNMWVNPGEIAGDGIDNDGNGYIDDVHGWDFANNDSDPMDDNGHGTACAGIIAAAGDNNLGVTGINWGGRIMALKYADENYVANTADVIQAVNYATMMRVQYGVNVRVTSNSYGIFGNSLAVRNAIDASGDAGILFVASAGNTNSDNDIGPQYPANFDLDNLLSVAATDRFDALASFSSYGATTVHLGAPGVSVLTTRVNNSYSGFSGTSAAAPMVAGVAALLWDAAPYASVADVRAAILAGTDPIAALAGITVTGGRLNAFGALQQLGFYVHDVTPNVSGVVSTPPLDFSVQLSHQVDMSTVDASDFLVNGITADSYSVGGDNTIFFHFNTSPVTSQGLQTMTLVGGSITRLTDGAAVSGFTGNFRYDASPLTVMATTPNSGGQADLPMLTLIVSFNEAIDPSTIGNRDLILSQGTVVGASALDSMTAQFTLSGVKREGELFFYLPSGSITDVYGNAVSAYSGTLDLDVTQSDLGAFEYVEPLGSLVYASRDNLGVINQAGDVDDLTFALAAGETVTALIRPTDPSAVLTAQWVGLAGSAIVGTPGGTLLVPITKASLAGQFALRISGDRRTEYTVEVFRNSIFEIADSTPSSPVVMQASKLDLGDGRFAVIGSSQVDSYFADMTTNPGWTNTGNWAYGQPAGLAGDPSSGFTGPNVVGYNLNGAYPSSLLGTQYVTTGPINMTGQTNVQLSFRRWLGIDTSTLDRANIQVSNNGTTWTTVWQHTGVGIFETSWSQQTYDISAVADNQATVYVRWGLGRTSAANNYWGWNIDDVVVGSAGELQGDVDHYTLDLTGYAGKRLDVALAGLNGVDFSQQSLKLLGPSGTVIAVASAAPTGAIVTNYDLGLVGYIIPSDGVYTLVVESHVDGEYSLVVTQSVAIETEPSDDPSGPVTSLDAAAMALGHVGVPLVEGLYNFTINTAASVITLSGTVSAPDGSFTVPLTEQTVGSLDAQIQGTIAAILAGQAVTFVEANVDPIANAGNFLPFGGAADFAAQVNLFGINAYAAITNLTSTAFSSPLLLNGLGEFDSQGIYFEFTNGEIDYQALGDSGTFPVATPDSSNQALIPGRVEILPGELRLTIPLRMQFTVSVPLGILVDFRFDAIIVASAPLPILDEDVYAITAAAGETIVLATATPFDEAGALPANTLNPELRLLAPDGSLVAFDLDSASDGKNARILFTASQAGTYRVVVAATAGKGDYTLLVDRYLPTSLSINAPTAAVRGQTRTFELNLQNAASSDATFHIDWNDDGIVDQTLTGTTFASVQHIFAANGIYNVHVTAIDSLGRIGETSHVVTVTSYALQADEADPSKTNLVVGGTTGGDLIAVLGAGPNLLLWHFGFDGANATFASGSYATSATGVTGRVIIYGQSGADLISTQLLIGRSAIIDAGGGDDLVVAGAGADLLYGGDGNDVIFGGAGADELHGQGGDDLLFGGLGADLVSGGLGSDLLIAGSSVFETDSGAALAIRAEWTSPRSYDDKTANLSGTGFGLRANGNIFLQAGVSVHDDAAVDQVFGDEDRDWFVMADDDINDSIPDELVTDLTGL